MVYFYPVAECLLPYSPNGFPSLPVFKDLKPPAELQKPFYNEKWLLDGKLYTCFYWNHNNVWVWSALSRVQINACRCLWIWASTCIYERLTCGCCIHVNNTDVKISWSGFGKGQVLLDSLNNRNISHVYSVWISLYLWVKFHMGNRVSC